MSLPQATAGPEPVSFVDALFTATSAVCVTGLVVVETGAFWSRFGQVVILVLIQIGGLGIMTLSTLFFLILKKRITLRERLLIRQDLSQPGLTGLIRLVRYILLVTLLYELVGAVLLYPYLLQLMNSRRAFYYSIFHAVSAFCNAGFDLFGNSLQDFTGSPYINFVFALLIISGGLGFTVLHEIFRDRKWRGFTLHSKFVILLTLILLLLGFGLVLLLEVYDPGHLGVLTGPQRLLSSFFLSVTARTAGFTTVPIGDLSPSILFFLLFLMFIGASPASTGGGVKTTTFGTIFLMAFSHILGRKDVELFHRRLDRRLVSDALVIVLLALIWIFVVTLILLVVENHPFLAVLFETASAFGTVGLSMGITGELSSLGRLILTLTMFIGRVGPLTVALAVGEREHKYRARLPEEKILIG